MRVYTDCIARRDKFFFYEILLRSNTSDSRCSARDETLVYLTYFNGSTLCYTRFLVVFSRLHILYFTLTCLKQFSKFLCVKMSTNKKIMIIINAIKQYLVLYFLFYFFFFIATFNGFRHDY